MDETQRGIVFPAREFPAAEVQQVAAGVQKRMQLFKSAGDERADVRHRGVLPDEAREGNAAIDFVDYVDIYDKV